VTAQVGATTMIVTHNAVVADIADRIIRFSDGAVVELRDNPAKRKPGELSW
jgi:putative ABC transport system ATP-binding protein